MLCSSTPGHLPNSALELRLAEPTISASQIKAHLQNNDIVKHSAPQAGAHGIVPGDSSLNADADLVPTFADRMMIIPCQGLRPVDVEHTFTCLSTECYLHYLHYMK